MAIFKFFQSIFSMAAFAYNGFVGLKWQLLILVRSLYKKTYVVHYFKLAVVVLEMFSEILDH